LIKKRGRGLITLITTPEIYDNIDKTKATGAK
jgi:hypothetical protein